jgi:hypothetical protein
MKVERLNMGVNLAVSPVTRVAKSGDRRASGPAAEPERSAVE